MDIKLRRYSHSMIAKVIVFMVAIVCFTNSVTIFINIIGMHDNNFGIAFEKSFFLGNGYLSDSSDVVNILNDMKKYKSEDYILSGKSLTNDQITTQEEILFNDFENNSKSFNPNLTTEENTKIFKEVYADKISQIKDKLIKQKLNAYNSILRRLEKYQGIKYYVKNGENEFTNGSNKGKEYFKSFPAYMIFEGSKIDIFPKEVTKSSRYNRMTYYANELGQQDIMYVAFTKEFLNPRITQWEADKISITNSLQQLAGFLTVLVIAFIYLLWVIGRKPQMDQGIQLNTIDRIYNDLKISMCIMLIGLWFAIIVESNIFELTYPLYQITILIVAIGLILVLSLVKHLKNRTFFKHTFIFSILHKLCKFVSNVYNSGSVGFKVVLIVIGYPAVVAITFFIFPVTIGVAAWIAIKKAKEFNAIKEGVIRVKDGDIHHIINVSGGGEFARLASNVNSITDGLSKAVENGIKSERLKSELITNVSHDIRTPLTSIITYVDLLKSERDQVKIDQYLEIIDQKSQRLKVLTEDLFEATKASSGNMPVNFDKIDIVALITQGLGELDDEIKDRKLEFRICHPEDNVYIRADGKLMWRAVENLLSNILKYALEGSRVYIDILYSDEEVMLIIKNISAHELNISSDELMERFKRGDDSRGSQGSGLGLSIAKGLIEIQKGSFKIEIDGDLFKAIIQMTKEV